MRCPPELHISKDLQVELLETLPTVGDVVTAYSVQNPRHIVCKRVLGLEGDTIKVPWSSTNGPARTVKVMSVQCTRGRMQPSLQTAFAHACILKVKCCLSQLCHAYQAQLCIQVPAGHVWLQGDNTLNSTDSRHYGPVPYALVNGKAFLKVCKPSCLRMARSS